jgi:hypothetical protein
MGSGDHFADGAAGIGDPVTALGEGRDEIVCCDVHRARLSAAP